MAGVEKPLLIAGLVTVTSAVGSFGVHQYYESNIAPLTEGATRDADKESPAVPPDELDKAFTIRNNFLNGISPRRPYNVKDSTDPYFPFDPDQIRESASQPELLQARVTLNQQTKYVDVLTRIRAERHLDLKEFVPTALQGIAHLVTLCGSVYSLGLGMISVANRKFRNRRPIPA